MMLYKYLQAIRKEKRYLANLYYGAFPDVSPDVKEFHALHKIARRFEKHPGRGYLLGLFRLRCYVSTGSL